MAKILLDYKANPMATDQNRKSALYYAHLHGHDEIVHLLLRKSRGDNVSKKKDDKDKVVK